jgi:hypothetical protein
MQSERLLAAFLHLAYLPGVLGILLVIAFPETKTVILPLCALWLMSMVAGLLFKPKSEFLGNHLYEARSYHVKCFLFIAVAFVVLFATGIFTLGVGSMVAVMLVPCALIICAVPTVKAAYRAFRGQPYEYGSHGGALERMFEAGMPKFGRSAT